MRLLSHKYSFCLPTLDHMSLQFWHLGEVELQAFNTIRGHV